MKTFDEIEQLWRLQTIVVRDNPPAIRAVRTAADRVVNSRRRRLRLGVGFVVFSIFAVQLLTVVNFLYGHRTPNAIALVHLAVVQGCQIVFFIALLRRIRADRELRHKSASNVRENLRVSLELIKSEIRDYRWLLPLFAGVVALEVIPLFNGYHLGYFDRAGLVHRLVSLLGFIAVMFSVALRHSRSVLLPRRQELLAVLSELEAD